MKKYVLGIDQSTQGTKGIIFDGSGKIIARTDLAHDQIINEKGWVEHNPDQIMKCYPGRKECCGEGGH